MANIDNISDYKNRQYEYLPRMLNKEELEDEIAIYPEYDPRIRNGLESARLLALEGLYNIYIPCKMSQEIYVKVFLALSRSLSRKTTLGAVKQYYNNMKLIKSKGKYSVDFTGTNQPASEKHFTSIMGGIDSFSIIGESGIGKSATISRILDVISARKIIVSEDGTKIIPAISVQTPADCSIKGLLLEMLRKIDEVLGTNYYHHAISFKTPTDSIIGTVSSVVLNHVGLLVVDEIQNVISNKNGKALVGMLIHLINNTGICICFVGTPESAEFFSSTMMLARRTTGIMIDAMEYDEEFMEFCSILFEYQYCKKATELTDEILIWLYQHSAGNRSIVVGLIHDAQEIAIIDGEEEININTLSKAYTNRLGFLHEYIQPKGIENYYLDEDFGEKNKHTKHIKKETTNDVSII